jgi:hypothetical protein
LFLQTLQGMRKELGRDHPTTLTSLGSLAAQYEGQGRYVEAEPLLREGLAAQRTKSGPDSVQVAAALATLGQNLLRQGKPAEAEPLLRECLAIRQKKLPNNWLRFNAQSLFGASLAGQKKYAEAEPLLLHGYEGLKQHEAKDLGASKARLTEALEQLVRLYETWGKPDAAAKWRQESEAAQYGDQGRPVEAEPLLRQRLADQRISKSGPDSVQVAAALATLGQNLIQQRKYAEAESLLCECLAIWEKKLPDDGARFNAQSLLGASLAGQKKYAEAEPLLVQGYEGLKAREAKIPPAVKHRLTEALEQLVQLYEATGKPDEAAKWRKELEERKAPEKK